MKHVTLLIAAFVSLEAHSQRALSRYGFEPVEYPTAKIDAYSSQLRYHQKVLNELANFNLISMDARIDRNTADPSTRSAIGPCRDYYKSLYDRDRILIRAVYGYYDNYVAKDGKSTVYLGDQAEMKILRDKFTAPCNGPTSFACGFSGEGERLQRTVEGPTGRTATVTLELISSSHSANDRMNRMDGNFNRATPEQQKASDYAEAKFLEGFHGADVLVYLGHARAGGGPSFHPPVLKSSSGQDPVDFGYYTSSRTGFKKMAEALASSATPPKVLALFACRSAPLFADGGNPLARRMGNLLTDNGMTFIGTSGLTDSNTDLRNFVGLVDGIVGQRCSSGFKSGVSVRINGNRTDIVGPTP